MGFEKVYTFTRSAEGGYVNDPEDPGGETNFGITHTTYTNYRQRNHLAAQSVHHISEAEVVAIYKEFWHKSRCDLLPDYTSMAHFDFSFHSGPGNSGRILQRVLGIDERHVDGVIGPNTIALVQGHDDALLARKYVAARREFLHHTRAGQNPRFAQGLQNRVNNLERVIFA